MTAHRSRPVRFLVDGTVLSRADEPVCNISAGGLHSIQFLISQRCSRPSPSLYRSTVMGSFELGAPMRFIASAPFPRGDKPLNPLSPVPAVLAQDHLMFASIALR